MSGFNAAEADFEDDEITALEKVRRYAEMRINQLKGRGVL